MADVHCTVMSPETTVHSEVFGTNTSERKKQSNNNWPEDYFTSYNYVNISALGSDLSKVSGILDKKGKVSAKRST